MTQAVAFMRQLFAFMGKLLLKRLDPLIIESVVHGHGDLSGHLLQEFEVGVVVGGFLQAPESERA